MKKTNKSIAEEIADKIKSMPIDPEYRESKDIPIPLGRGVLVKKLSQSFTKTETGLFLANGDNTTPPHLGIIQAVGPLCSEYLRVGLRCYYNFYVDSSFWLGGVEYAKMDENDVYYIVPPKALVMETPKSDKRVKTEKKMISQSAANERIFQHEQNEKDKLLELKSGKKINYILKK